MNRILRVGFWLNRVHCAHRALVFLFEGLSGWFPQFAQARHNDRFGLSRPVELSDRLWLDLKPFDSWSGPYYAGGTVGSGCVSLLLGQICEYSEF